MITARGIYNNLKESTYSFTIYDLIFYFSSQKYKEKFKAEVEDYISYQEKKLKSFYKIEIDFKKFLAVAFYKKIEKRGFRVIVINGEGKRFEKSEIKITNEIL